MSCKCRMRRIDTGVQNRDLDRTVWSNSSVNLMGPREVNLFRRPLRHKRIEVAPHTPDVPDAPDVAATDGWYDDEIWFNEINSGITRQCFHAVIDVSIICNSQAEDRAGAKLIDRN